MELPVCSQEGGHHFSLCLSADSPLPGSYGDLDQPKNSATRAALSTLNCLLILTLPETNRSRRRNWPPHLTHMVLPGHANTCSLALIPSPVSPKHISRHPAIPHQCDQLLPHFRHYYSSFQDSCSKVTLDPRLSWHLKLQTCISSFIPLYNPWMRSLQPTVLLSFTKWLPWPWSVRLQDCSLWWDGTPQGD